MLGLFFVRDKEETQKAFEFSTFLVIFSEMDDTTSRRSQANLSQKLILLSFIVFVHVVLHLKYLDLPPIGFHQWRQTQTLSVARNFYEEGMDLLKPRVDSRGSGSGITGMEFPLVNAIIAEGFEIFGYRNAVSRTTILVFSIGAIVFCYLFFASFFESEGVGLFSAFALTFSPLFSYYSIVAIPDIPSVAFLFVALWSFWQFRESGMMKFLFIGGSALLLGGLIKVSALLVVPVLFVSGFSISEWKKRIALTGVLITVGLIVLAWILYARYLSEAYNNFDFKLEGSFPFSLSVVAQVSKRVFIQWLPELYINYAEFILFLFGLWMISKESDHVWRYGLIYAICLVIFMIAFFPMLEFHDYYMLPALPLLIMITTVGFRWWQNHRHARTYLNYLFILLMCLIPTLGSIRALSRFEGAAMSEDLKTIEQFLNTEIPDRGLLVIAASDNSPSIYLYFMHRKGWSITDEVTEERWSEIVSKGASYLVSDSRKLEGRPEIASAIRKLSSHGEFNLFAIESLIGNK